MPDLALLDQAIEGITALRGEGAHVHSITNTVAQNFTANVLLASGATVSMTANPKEIESFMQHANALHVNLGTLDDERIEAINKAVVIAQEKAIPITLDPVMIHVSEQRRELAKTLVKFSQIIRGNRSEINALDVKLASEVCLVKTGQVDEIWQGGKVVKIENGHALMDRVIATGCALGALIAPLSAKTSSPFMASLAGVLWFSIAGEIAAEKTSGPGSFQTAFLDELHNVSEDTIREKARFA